MKTTIAVTSLALLAIPVFLLVRKFQKDKNDLYDPWRGIVQF
jgi:hypothetical protein